MDCVPREVARLKDSLRRIIREITFGRESLTSEALAENRL